MKDIDDCQTKDFYLSKIPDQSSVKLDLSLIVGIGGESIIIKSTKSTEYDSEDFGGSKVKRHLAVKASPYDTDIGTSIGFIDARLGKEKQKLPELIPTTFQHKNIIQYWRNLLQKVDPTLFHLSGMLFTTRI